MYGSPVTHLISNLPEKSIRIYCSSSVNYSRLIFLVINNWYFIFPLQLTQAVHVLNFSPMSFRIPAQQNVLLSARTFVEPSCPKCSVSTTFPFSSSDITILSPANIKPIQSVSLVKTGENFLGAGSLWLIHRECFDCNNFASTELLWIRVFKSSMNLIQISRDSLLLQRLQFLVSQSCGSLGKIEWFSRQFRNFLDLR